MQIRSGFKLYLGINLLLHNEFPGYFLGLLACFDTHCHHSKIKLQSIKNSLKTSEIIPEDSGLDKNADDAYEELFVGILPKKQDWLTV